MQETTLRWGDGYLFVEPAFPDTLTPKLRYWRRSLDWSEEQMRRVATGRYEELYQVQSWIDESQRYCQRLLTLPGFMHRVKRTLREAGWKYTIHDERTPFPKPDFAAACKGLYDHQVECAYTAIQSGGGVVACPTGWGKTHIIKAIVSAFAPADLQARGTPLVVVTTPDKDITAKDYEDLKNMLPDREVGLVMSGYNRFSDDVQVITLDSLHRLNPDEIGIVIVDEVHAAVSDKRTESLLAMRRAARWGVSATPSGRFDGRDLVTEGVFGPVVYTRSYSEGVKDGALVPIKVYWVECPEPSVGLERYERFVTRAGRYRHAVTHNEARNALIGDIIKRTPVTKQTLCIMQFLQQMNMLFPHCGDGVDIVHAETDAVEIARMKNLYAVTPKERRDIYQRMRTGSIRKILSTYVYKQGVNFPDLEVVINAGGGGSDIVARQIPGRESRKTAEKQQSYLVDFWHPWDRSKDKKGRIIPGPVHQDDQAREKAYSQLGFEQTWVNNVNQLPFVVTST